MLTSEFAKKSPQGCTPLTVGVDPEDTTPIHKVTKISALLKRIKKRLKSGINCPRKGGAPHSPEKSDSTRSGIVKEVAADNTFRITKSNALFS